MSIRSCFHSRPRTVRAGSLAVAVAVLAGGCGGPQAPLAIGAKSVPLDLVLGARKAVAGAPVPPVAFRVGPNGLPVFSFEEFGSSSSPPRRTRSTTPPPEGCIENPLAVAKAEAPRQTALNPFNATYTYRAQGTFKEGGANATEGQVPDTAKVQVLNSSFEVLTGESVWQTAVTLGPVTTTTSYRSRTPWLADGVIHDRAPGVVPPDRGAPEPPDEEEAYPEPGTDPFDNIGPLRNRGVKTPPYVVPVKVRDNAAPPRGVYFGIYIEKVETTGAVPFQPPAPGLLLAKFPLSIGDTFDVGGSDGVTTMRYRTTVLPHATVDACGFPIHTWTIELTRGTVAKVDTAEAVDFNARYQVATQFGGLIVADDVKVTADQVRTQGLVRVERHVKTTTMTAPGA